MWVTEWSAWLRGWSCAALLWACGGANPNAPINTLADGSAAEGGAPDGAIPALDAASAADTSALTASADASDSAAQAADSAGTRDATSTGVDGAQTSGDASTVSGDGSTQPSSALVHYLGRFDTTDPAGPKCSWPGSAIMATFTGTGITAQLIDAGTNYFTVVIDGGTPTVVPTGSQTQTYTLATGLAAGQHTVVLTKRTESYVGVVQILGLQPQGGALVPSPEPFSRRIELVGDSITCGYGDLGIGPNCSWSASTEDETITYGALTANQLNAEATVIAYSGIGMYQNANGVTTNQMPVLFERTLADDATSQWGFTTPAPDVVVINLGTNDFANGDPGQAYVTAYVAFLRQVRGHYANATIICTTSPMLGSTNNAHAIEASYIQSAISQVSDPRVSFMDFAAQDQANGLGCDWHPSPKTHQLMATTLVAQVNSLTGW